MIKIDVNVADSGAEKNGINDVLETSDIEAKTIISSNRRRIEGISIITPPPIRWFLQTQPPMRFIKHTRTIALKKMIEGVGS
jgi:hypothetical protein